MNPLALINREIEQLKARLRLQQEYKTVFESPEGQGVLHDLFRECGVFKTSMDNNSSNMTAFNEGKRAIALHIQSRLRTDNVLAIQRLLMEKSNDNQRPPDDRNAYTYRDDASPILS